MVRRIFERLRAGRHARARDREAAQRRGRAGTARPPWRDTAIRGHRQRGTGILNNELYIGRLVWNRQRYVKDPETGKRRLAAQRRRRPRRRGRARPAHRRRRGLGSGQAPPGRDRGTPQVSDQGVRLLVAAPCRASADRARLLWRLRQPASRGRPRLPGLLGRPGPGTCINRKGDPPRPLEQLILDALRQRLMQPEVVRSSRPSCTQRSTARTGDGDAASARGCERELAGSSASWRG